MVHVLVVDDEPAICELLSDCLRNDLHARVDCAHDGRDGLKLLKASHYDLALIDAILPGINGFRLAELAANDKTPVLLVSGNPSACEQLERFGFPHLSKPFALDVLVSEARAAMQAMGRTSAGSTRLPSRCGLKLKHSPMR